MSASSPYQPPSSEPASASEGAPKPISLRDPVGRVRLVGMLEGISFLVLLGIAMPLKYMAGMPMAVRVTGMIHGVLFLLFLLVIFQAWGNKALTTKQSALAFLASLIPFGPFLIDRRLAESATQSGDSAD
jgi:integral membrane protein